MKDKLKLQSISYDRFEANEGKSVSDSLGSISKCAFLRGVVKKDEGISSLTDVIDLIRSELNVSTKKFKFFEVLPFDFIERKVTRPELVIPNVSKKHSVTVRGDDVISHVWTCTDCTVATMCENCKKAKGISKTNIKIKEASKKRKKKEAGENVEEEEREEVEEEVEDEEVVEGEIEKFVDEEDDGQTDDDNEDDDDPSDDEDEEDEFKPGDIVWGLWGTRWYPGILSSLNDVPQGERNQFKSIDGHFIILWYGEKRYSLIRKVMKLGITQDDAKKAARSKAMQKLYNKALADLV